MYNPSSIWSKLSEIQNSKEISEIGFLSAENQVEKVIVTSYPRSGNTLCREYIETLTRTVIGSDIKCPMLSELGLKGELVMDNRVWIVKSHFPERKGAN